MSATDGSTVLRISRLGLLGLGLLILAPWTVVLWRERAPAPVPGAAKPPPIFAGTGTPAMQGALNPGPWGELAYNSILIEPPEAFIPISPPTAQPRWVFKGYSDNAVRALWQAAGLTEAQQTSLRQPEHQSTDAGGIMVRPSPEDITRLSADAREKIYSALADFPENPAQHDPFRFRADSADDWFKDAGISPDIIAETKRLTYQRNGIVFFSDQDIILPRIPTATERVRYLKALSRKSAFLIYLRVRHGADAAELTRYWGGGRRAKDIEPLLLSLSRLPDGGVLDIVHLLPRFARALLYTYPLPSDQPTDAAYDCHWTTFNFYRDQPDPRFTNIDYVKQTLASDYYPVVGEPKFGDVILLLQPGGVVIHSCVFVADDIVFTKNGPGYSVPWLLARLGNVVSFYGRGRELEVRRYRSKEL